MATTDVRDSGVSDLGDGVHPGDNYVLFSQPIVELWSGRVSHFELLLRIRRADGKLSLPGEFTDAVRQSGGGAELDHWVASRALSMLFPPDQQPGPQIEINISRQSAIDPEFPLLLNGVLEKRGVAPDALIVEVAYGDSVEPGEMRHFSDRKFKLAYQFNNVDSEVEAFSKLRSLPELPFDWVKIDGEFVRGLGSNPTNQAIVRRVAGIARGFGRRTVALHIEDADTARFLYEVGVDYGQGYFFGHPEPVDAS
jgi:EAL domain-containing protein (putative c-di-GMP-specific phosphodiesterase class I)